MQNKKLNDKIKEGITLHEVIKELRRELQMRQSVYPGLIAKQKIDRYTANRRYLLLEIAKNTLIELKHDIEGNGGTTDQQNYDDDNKKFYV